jgi:hypothetical protein
MKASYNVYRNNTIIYERFINKSDLNKKTLELLEVLPRASSTGVGKNRRFFASALTPDGPIDFTDKLLSGTIYALRARDGMGADIVLSDIQTEANRRGFNTESFFCPLKPSKIEHLTIPELGLSYTTSNQYHPSSLKIESEINFEEFCSPLHTYREEIKYNDSLFEMLIGKTMETMRDSRSIHEQIEGIYITAMDFFNLDITCRQLTVLLKEAAGRN